MLKPAAGSRSPCMLVQPWLSPFPRRRRRFVSPLTLNSIAPVLQLLRITHRGLCAGIWHDGVELVAHAHVAHGVVLGLDTAGAAVAPVDAHLAIEPGAAVASGHHRAGPAVHVHVQAVSLVDACLDAVLQRPRRR